MLVCLQKNQGGNEHYWRGLGQVWLGSVSICIAASVTDDNFFFCWENEPGFCPSSIQAFIVVYVVKAQKRCL